MPYINNEKNITKDLVENAEKSNFKVVSLAVLLSFLFGIAGSVFGSTFFVRNGIAVGPGTDIKAVNVKEESGVVEVVKKSSPAVVSIIISKDLNKIPGYSTSPFDFGPFSFDPFFQNRNQQKDSTAPNIQQVGGGSGFIISSDGLIMTNRHVVQDSTATYTVLTNDGKKYDATVLSRDPINDLAMVKISGKNLPTLPLGDSSSLQIGQIVIAIGNSLGQYSNTVTKGIVSGIGRTITAGGTVGSSSEQLEGVIQTDAAINPGNSGGPLLDIGGSVIGINTAIDSQGQLIGFAIPVNDIKKDVDSFKKFGRIIKPFLGIRYVLVNESIQQQDKLGVDYGALIVPGDSTAQPAVVAGSAADKAGLKEGDIILQINGKKISQEHSLASYLKDFNPGDTVKMTILSQGSNKDITVTLGESK